MEIIWVSSFFFGAGNKTCRNGSHRHSSGEMAERWTFKIRCCWNVFKMHFVCYMWTMHNVCCSFVNSWYPSFLIIILELRNLLLWILFITFFISLILDRVYPILGIKEVYYGCANEKFGGCGSILSLHSSALSHLSGLFWNSFLHASFYLRVFFFITTVFLCPH